MGDCIRSCRGGAGGDREQGLVDVRRAEGFVHLITPLDIRLDAGLLQDITGNGTVPGREDRKFRKHRFPKKSEHCEDLV